MLQQLPEWEKTGMGNNNCSNVRAEEISISNLNVILRALCSSKSSLQEPGGLVHKPCSPQGGSHQFQGGVPYEHTLYCCKWEWGSMLAMLVFCNIYRVFLPTPFSSFTWLFGHFQELLICSLLFLVSFRESKREIVKQILEIRDEGEICIVGLTVLGWFVIKKWLSTKITDYPHMQYTTIWHIVIPVALWR